MCEEEFHVHHSFITTRAFLSSDGKISWLLLSDLVSLLLGLAAQCNQITHITLSQSFPNMAKGRGKVPPSEI